jgi:hypothetical protein
VSDLKVDKRILKDGREFTHLTALKSDWIQRLVYLDGKPFNYKDREYLKTIVNGNYHKKLLLFSRQTEKSSSLASDVIASMALNPHYKILYVSPSHIQTRQFSNGKLKPWMQDSPLIKKYLLSSDTSSQVFEKGFTNGAMIYLRSAFLTADRARGISASLLCLDELQDLLTANIPVIEECLSHAEDPREIMSGTPKSRDNLAEVMWQRSSMNEWLIPCDRHSPPHYNYIDEKIIGLNGPICNKCGGAINPAAGRWISFNDAREIMGFRVASPMVPWIYQREDKWKELLWKKNTYSKGLFYNECLGISYDSASKPITRTELIECCSSKHKLRLVPDDWTSKVDIFAGLDIGEGSDGTERGFKGKLKVASYTVLTLGTYIDPTTFYIFYYRKFTGNDALAGNCISEIIRTLQSFKNLRCLGTDFGHGWGVNDRLEEVFGPQRVVKFQHVGFQKERKKYDPIGHKFQLNRNEVITDFLMAIKDHKIVWPAWESVKDFLVDFEHVFAEYNEYTRTIRYDHKPTEPDDVMHSSIYAKEAADNFYRK